MASATPAARYSGYLQIKQAGVQLGLFPVPVGTPCDKRAWKDTPENRANLRPSLPVYDNVQYVPGGCADLALVVAAATKCTALAIVRVRDGNSNYLSLLASGTGTLSYELIGLGNTASPNPSKKVFDTASGPFPVPSAIGSSTAAYGGFYGSPANGDYRLKIYDDAGGVDTYTIPITDNGAAVVVKGGFGTPGGGGGSGGGGTGTPTVIYQGKIDHISPSRRPDLMSIQVTPYKETDGTWRMKFDDVATGSFEKYYRGIGPGSWLTLAQLRALRMPFGHLYAISCMQMSGPPDDSKINDQAAHCVQFIYGI